MQCSSGVNSSTRIQNLISNRGNQVQCRTLEDEAALWTVSLAWENLYNNIKVIVSQFLQNWDAVKFRSVSASRPHSLPLMRQGHLKQAAGVPQGLHWITGPQGRHTPVVKTEWEDFWIQSKGLNFVQLCCLLLSPLFTSSQKCRIGAHTFMSPAGWAISASGCCLKKGHSWPTGIPDLNEEL